MPELPEVEVTRRGLEPHLAGKRLLGAVVRNPRLRHPIPDGIAKTLAGLTVRAVRRRGKYLLLDCGAGWLILHLGMSGSLRVLPATTLPEKHDHFDLLLEDGLCLRLRDPRRFGGVVWTEKPPSVTPSWRPWASNPSAPISTAPPSTPSPAIAGRPSSRC